MFFLSNRPFDTASYLSGNVVDFGFFYRPLYRWSIKRLAKRVFSVTDSTISSELRLYLPFEYTPEFMATLPVARNAIPFVTLVMQYLVKTIKPARLRDKF
jgi:hypothetical protein